MPTGRSLPRPAPGTLKWWIIGTIGIGGGIALAIWFGLAMSLGQPWSQTTGYKIVSDQEVEVQFDVRSPDSVSLRCSIEALARDFAVLGTADVDVKIVNTNIYHATGTVRTAARAVTGQVTGCVPLP